MRRHLPLVAILAVAAAVRLWGIGFGLPHTMCRPDEEAIHAVAFRFFTRDLNPHFFTYPTLFIYVAAAMYVVYFKVGKLFGYFTAEWRFLQFAGANPSPFFLMGRMASAAAGVASVAVAYAIGQRLFDRITGLVAAAFLALAFLHVRDSHFGVMDVAATFLALLSFLHTVRFARERRKGALVLSAVFAGLAASTKYNLVMVVAPGVAVVAGLRLDGGSAAPGWSMRGRELALYAALVAGAFLFGTPFALADWRLFTSEFFKESLHLATGHGPLLGRGWFVHLASSLRYGLGLPLLLVGVAGLAWMWFADRRAALLTGLFPVTYFLAMGWGYTAFARYMVPVVPFLCLTAAWAVTRLARSVAAARRREGWAPALAAAMAAVIVAPSAWNVVQLDRRLATTDSRLLAAQWCRQHLPPGTRMYQTGSIYSRIQLTVPTAGPPKGEWGFDEADGRFTIDGAVTTAAPDVVIVQTSALSLYTPVPQGLEAILARDYQVAWRITAHALPLSGSVYDWQDAFFLPLAGFAGIERPGPNIVIYRRVAALEPV